MLRAFISVTYISPLIESAYRSQTSSVFFTPVSVDSPYFAGPRQQKLERRIHTMLAIVENGRKEAAHFLVTISDALDSAR